MRPLTGVIKHLVIINVLVYAAAILLLRDLNSAGGLEPGDRAISFLGLFYPIHMPSVHQFLFQPHQIITHMFMHGGVTHLLFNMLGLYFLGPMVEQRLGAKKFLGLYFAAGFGAMILHLVSIYCAGTGFDVPVVGASGALMGVVVAFAVLYPNVKLMLLFPPIPVKAKILVPIIVAIDIFGGISPIDSPIAHFAHLGGAIVGFLMIMYWKRTQIV